MKQGRFIVIVLDGFGIGYMQDTKTKKIEDFGSNTIKSIVKKVPHFKLKTLQSLGLMNAAEFETEFMKKSNNCIFGQANLMHYGADTFQGHQEIMGSTPFKPEYRVFMQDINLIENHLIKNGYKVERYKDQGKELLIVENALTIADNIEAQEGLAYNVSASLDNISFNKVVEIGTKVREITKVTRIISFGGKNVTLKNILNAKEHKGNGFGINTPKSGIYNEGYNVIHLGYGVNYKKQVPYCLTNKNVNVHLIGKVADIVYNPKGKSISVVDTKKAFEHTLKSMHELKESGGFICLNVQETDLAGHKEDALDYYNVLTKADSGISSVINEMQEQDILIIMADHGNDPLIGHSGHTREKVPLLVYKQNMQCNAYSIGERKTLADVGKTVADYFNIKDQIENGESFLTKIQNN